MERPHSSRAGSGHQRRDAAAPDPAAPDYHTTLMAGTDDQHVFGEHAVRTMLRDCDNHTAICAAAADITRGKRSVVTRRTGTTAAVYTCVRGIDAYRGHRLATLRRSAARHAPRMKPRVQLCIRPCVRL